MGKRKERDIRFYEALQSGNLDEVKDFIDHDGIDANEPIEYSYASDLPLHIASQYGHLPIVQYLVEECKVNVEAGRNEYTAVYHACFFEHLDIVRHLAKECHVNLEGGTSRSGTFPESVLVRATDGLQNRPYETVWFLAQECHINVNSTVGSDYGRTPLHLASRNCFLKSIECLMQYRHANVEIKDDDGFTPLLYVVYKKYVCLKTVQYLVQSCKANAEAKHNMGSTAMHICCSRNLNLEVVQYFAQEYHLNVEAKDCYGRTPLHVACLFIDLNTSMIKSDTIVRYLVQECHVNVEASDQKGFTALHFCCKNDRYSLIQFLIEVCHVNTEAQDIDGHTTHSVARRLRSLP